jgi:hypothetical protein
VPQAFAAIFALKALIKISVFLLVHLLCFQHFIFAQDTLRTAQKEKPVKKIFKAESARATMLAVAFPGLGQIYNRKYWKVPFVYAGFGGLVYAVSYNSKWYNDFMKSYQDFTDQVPETAYYLNLPMFKNTDPSTYDPALHPSEASWYKDRMLKGIDYFKKYRDLSYIGFAVWYLVTILDANVDASLFNYDISDNLDIDVTPVQMSMSGQTGMGLNLSLRVTF